MRKNDLEKYSSDIHNTILNTQFFDHENKETNKDSAMLMSVELLKKIKQNNKKIMFVGNGGSAAIASHMAQDFSKMAGLRSICFNDGSMLTCHANDYSFEEVFSKAIEMHADAEDTVVAVSSSGRSQNILNAALSAKRLGCNVITLSGFSNNNPLSKLGHINIYTPSSSYGIVESAHGIILHSFLDHIASKNSA